MELQSSTSSSSPSISDIASLNARFQAAIEKRDQNNDLLRQLQEEVKNAFRQRNLSELELKALSNVLENTPQPTPLIPPSQTGRKPNELISPQIQKLVVEKVLYGGEMSYEQAAATYGISRASVGRIISNEKKRKAEDEVTVPRKKGRKSPITINALLHLLMELEDNSTLTLKAMVQETKKTFDIDTSTSAIDRALDKMEISWKNVMPIPYDWNTTEIREKRQKFLFDLQRFLNRPKVYIDESGFHLHIRSSKGRALAGEKAILKTVPKGPRISLIAALSDEGYSHYQLFNSAGDKKRGVNATDFRLFLLDLAPKVPKNSVIILDNCRIHHAEILNETWRTLKEMYGIDHLFLPPYSPFLNPIEYSFNALKSKLKIQDLYNRNDLLSAIERLIPQVITKEKAKKWFDKSVKYYPQCGAGIPFNGSILKPIIEKDFQSSSVTGSSVSISSRKPIVEEPEM